MAVASSGCVAASIAVNQKCRPTLGEIWKILDFGSPRFSGVWEEREWIRSSACCLLVCWLYWLLAASHIFMMPKFQNKLKTQHYVFHINAFHMSLTFHGAETVPVHAVEKALLQNILQPCVRRLRTKYLPKRQRMLFEHIHIHIYMDMNM